MDLPAQRNLRHVTYDDAGQITKIEELNIDGKVIALFGYPAYWDNGQPRKQFSVPKPPLGNLNAAAMTYDDENRVATWNGQGVTHDDDGNVTNGPLPPVGAGQSSPGMGTFGFDARNRLLTCNGVTYTYDAENLRIKAVTAPGATNWLLSPAAAPAQPLVRTKPDGTVTRYVWGLGLLYEEDSATQQIKTYHYDRRGAAVALSAPDGRTITDRWTYGAYGERLTRSGTTDTPFQFNGFFGVQTDSNGLLYMNARYYNVELRRFVSADPRGFGESANFYWFANGDPLSLADPFGLGAGDSSGYSFLNAQQNAAVRAQEVWLRHPDLYAEHQNAVWAEERERVMSSDGNLGGKAFYLATDAAKIALPIVLGLATEGLGDALFAPELLSASRAVSAGRTATAEGTQLFRVFGNEAKGLGQYYTTVNPGSVANFREAAGLFPGNSGQFVLQGTLKDTAGVIFRGAAPGPGGVGGGLSEVFVPNPQTQINILRVSGANPAF